MKKFTVALIALALVCSSVFAGISVTAGAGFGGQVIPKKDALSEIAISGMPKELGITAFAGAEYELDNNVTVYGDAYFTSLSKKSLAAVADEDLKDNFTLASEVVPVVNAIKASVITVNAGAGYSCHFDNISLLVGAGVDAKMYLVKAGTAEVPEAVKDYAKATIGEAAVAAVVKEYEEGYEKNIADILKITNKTIVLGASIKVKGTYQVDEHWGVSAQINPGIGLKIKGHADLADKDLSNGEKFETIFTKAKIVSGDVCIGATYKF